MKKRILELKAAGAVKDVLAKVPRFAMKEVGAAKALWRAVAESGDTIIWASRADRTRVLIVADKKTVRASFDMPRPKGDRSFREVLHGDGKTYLYANKDRVWQLKVGKTISWRQVWNAGQRGFGPSEAVPLKGCSACMMQSNYVTVVSPKWKKTGIIDISLGGYVQLARSDDGKQLLVSSYDTGTTAGGPVFYPEIMLYDVKKGGVVERARGNGPGRSPFFKKGSFYVRHKRKVHRVVEVTKTIPRAKGDQYSDSELVVDMVKREARVHGRKAKMNDAQLDLLWFVLQRIEQPISFKDYFGKHLKQKYKAADVRLFEARMHRMHLKLQEQGMSLGRMQKLPDQAGFRFRIER